MARTVRFGIARCRRCVETTSQVLIQGPDPKNIVGSQRVTYQYIIHPTELKNLKTGQAVFKSGSLEGRLNMPGIFWNTDGIELPTRLVTVNLNRIPETAQVFRADLIMKKKRSEIP